MTLSTILRAGGCGQLGHRRPKIFTTHPFRHKASAAFTHTTPATKSIPSHNLEGSFGPAEPGGRQSEKQVGKAAHDSDLGGERQRVPEQAHAGGEIRNRPSDGTTEDGKTSVD